MINKKRIRNLKKGRESEGHVLYWMSRDQRVNDNWAFVHAIELAENSEQSVIVVFALSRSYMGASWRQYDFMLKGLKKVEEHLIQLNIPFYILIGDPAETVPFFIRQHRICRMVVDFDPLRLKQQWRNQVIDKIEIPVDEVDAHNIVPCWIASDKSEFGAHTLRPRIRKLLPQFLDEFPPIVRQHGTFHTHRINWEAVSISIRTDHTVRPVIWHTPGENGAMVVFRQFLDTRLKQYAMKRNDPNAKFNSGLSPYLHFGHICSQRIALDIIRNIPGDRNTDVFLEELIIRKELADNYCYFNPKYDQIEGLYPWARKTLDDHRLDKREFIYHAEEFEEAKTHDLLWNAAQRQLTNTGSMHGYLRMYWAKKILEWTATPEDALRISIYLNDKYQLDGRDPNGYAGCAWSIGGIHDRAWGEREIFGKIRYMNRSGCERKFDVEKYISGNRN